MTADDVRKEVADIMFNTENPKNKLYHSKDKSTHEYVENLYKKAYGDAKVTIS